MNSHRSKFCETIVFLLQILQDFVTGLWSSVVLAELANMIENLKMPDMCASSS